MQKARRHPSTGTPTACKRMVSGSFSLPCSGCFSPFLHSTGSLSVFWEYLALRDGPRGFRQDYSCPALLRILTVQKILYIYGTVTLFGQTFQTVPLVIPCTYISPTTPTMPKHCRFGLFPVRSPLLRESIFLSSPPGTEMFQFPGFAPCCQGDTCVSGCPIRISADLVMFANPRSFSQLTTSFFASKSLGILHSPLLYFSCVLVILYYPFYTIIYSMKLLIIF